MSFKNSMSFFSQARTEITVLQKMLVQKNFPHVYLRKKCMGKV